MSDIIKIDHLKTVFQTENGIVQSVRDVSLQLEKGEVLGIVGESGSGKSVTMLSLMSLLAKNGTVINGEITFDEEPFLHVEQPSENLKNAVKDKTVKKLNAQYEKKMVNVRGKDIGMIFQDPMTFLNPILTIGYQLKEGLKRHTDLSDKECEETCIDMLKKVGLTSPETRMKQYPFELSGGMRQRVMIAMALLGKPKLLIADEPTTALDVTIQAQILELLLKLKDEMNMSIIMITHDLGVVASMCTRIVILYGGQIMEEGSDRDIFYHPKHPYTMGLLNSVASDDGTDKRLEPIEGSPPDLLKPPAGCAFVDRCKYAMKICKQCPPETVEVGPRHTCRCWLMNEQVQKLREEE